MTLVLVSGNLESAAVWDPLVRELDRTDVVRLVPPGFGAPVPEGWAGRWEDHRDWLLRELTVLARDSGSGVDLVGHDAGGGISIIALMAQPDLVRSWAVDVLGLFDPDYEWHELALAWQTPGVGESAVAELVGGDPEERTRSMVELGVTDPVVARALADAQDERMARAILALYRSVAQPVTAELGRDLERLAARPGLSLLAAADDVVGTEAIRRRAATRAGARTEVLDGLGHWWMVQDPARTAEALTTFWASLTDDGERENRT